MKLVRPRQRELYFHILTVRKELGAVLEVCDVSDLRRIAGVLC